MKRSIKVNRLRTYIGFLILSLIVLSNSYTQAQTPYVTKVQRQVLADLMQCKYCDSVRVALSAHNFDLKRENIQLSKALDNAESRATMLYYQNAALKTASQKDVQIFTGVTRENRALKREIKVWKGVVISAGAFTIGKLLKLY